jgi:hypothetical protein
VRIKRRDLNFRMRLPDGQAGNADCGIKNLKTKSIILFLSLIWNLEFPPADR